MQRLKRLVNWRYDYNEGYSVPRSGGVSEIPGKLPPPSRDAQRQADAFASLHQYDREPAAGGRVAALEQLHAIMVANAKLFQGADQDKRDAIVGQVLGIQHFLILQGFALPTLEPLMHTVSALVAREGNSPDPIFSERKGPGRPKRSSEDEHRSGALVAISEVWLAKTGPDERTQVQKLTELARRISGGWIGEVTAGKLKTARELVSQEASDHPAVQWANFYRSQCNTALALWDRQVVIDMLTRILNRKHPKI